MGMFAPGSIFGTCSASDDSDDDRLRGDDDKEAELMEELAMAQAMEPKSDVSVYIP